MSFNGASLKPILAANKNSLPTLGYSSSSTATLSADKTDKNGEFIVFFYGIIYLLAYI